MKPYAVYRSPAFRRSYQRLPQNVQIAAKRKVALLIENPRDSRLRTHKLQGELGGFLACSVTFSYRILFSIDDERHLILLLDIGTHDIYD